jgi:hypothetical protein
MMNREGDRPYDADPVEPEWVFTTCKAYLTTVLQVDDTNSQDAQVLFLFRMSLSILAVMSITCLIFLAVTIFTDKRLHSHP